ncbi:MAG: GGDEF domain-containing protein [Longibaculum sp.]
MKNENQAYDKYQEINRFWLNSHYQLICLGCLVGFIVEIVMMFIMWYFYQTSFMASTYIMKYILLPLFINIIVCLIGRMILKKHHFSFKTEQYLLSLLSMIQTFVFAMIHDEFVVVLLIQGIPILLTVIYEDERLTTIMTILSFVLIYVNGCYIFFDPDKVLNALYILNIMAIMAIVFIFWLISGKMIRFIEKKRKITIESDIKRFRLEKRIYMDGLTFIFNKSALDRDLDEIINDETTTYYLAMFDIDFFKQFNDSYGHLYGDNVLTCIGEILLTEFSFIHAYRYGGDEFCLLFKDMNEYEVMENLKKLQKLLLQKKIMEKDVQVTISIGVAKKIKNMTKNEWIDLADQALYQSKNDGRNRITITNEVKG